MNIQAWSEEFAGKRILIWGFGREGMSSLRWIRHSCGMMNVDIAEPAITEQLRRKAEAFGNVRLIPQAEADFSSYDMILKSPGIVIPPGMEILRRDVQFSNALLPMAVSVSGS